jgi:release factor glutamine methyltransferase
MDFWNINRISEQLEQLNIAVDREAMSMARWIWEDILQLHNQSKKKLNPEESNTLSHAIDRLEAGEPIQYIAGHAWFYGMKFKVNPDVLIPRPETEELVEWIISDFKKSSKEKIDILDIGTGSGCIAIVLKKKLGEKVNVIAVDVSEKAINVARENSAVYHLQIDFRSRDFLKKGFEGLGNFDIIVSNPPYISRQLAGDEIIHNLSYEPHQALYPPGQDSDIFYKKISEEAAKFLKDGGCCYLELNEFRAQEIEGYFRRTNWDQIEVRIDLQGLPRMIRVS